VTIDVQDYGARKWTNQPVAQKVYYFLVRLNNWYSSIVLAAVKPGPFEKSEIHLRDSKIYPCN
jgi:hypothetical protein